MKQRNQQQTIEMLKKSWKIIILIRIVQEFRYPLLKNLKTSYIADCYWKKWPKTLASQMLLSNNKIWIEYIKIKISFRFQQISDGKLSDLKPRPFKFLLAFRRTVYAGALEISTFYTSFNHKTSRKLTL